MTGTGRCFGCAALGSQVADLTLVGLGSIITLPFCAPCLRGVRDHTTRQIDALLKRRRSTTEMPAMPDEGGEQ